MKKFKFTLEKLLRHRVIQSELAQKDFLEMQSIFMQEQKKLQYMHEVKESSLIQRTELIQTSLTWTSQVEQINLFLIGQDLRIKNQNQRLIDVEKVVEEKREILRNAMIAVKMIEKLKERKYEAFKKEVQRTEQNELDELAVLRFSRTETLIKGSHEDGI